MRVPTCKTKHWELCKFTDSLLKRNFRKPVPSWKQAGAIFGKQSRPTSRATNAVQPNEPEEAYTWDVSESEGVQSSRRCVNCEHGHVLWSYGLILHRNCPLRQCVQSATILVNRQPPFPVGVNVIVVSDLMLCFFNCCCVFCGFCFVVVISYLLLCFLICCCVFLFVVVVSVLLLWFPICCCVFWFAVFSYLSLWFAL